MTAAQASRLPRILFAWELGANLGHVSKTAAIAERLAGRAELFLAMRDPAALRRIAPGLPCVLLPAPFHVGRPPARTPPGRSYADELRLCGWGDAVGLAALAEAWRGLVEATRPDVIAINSAPTLQLALRGRPRPPVVLFGSGFEIPPVVGSATPRYAFWRDADEAEEAARLGREAAVVEAANAALTGAGAPPVAGVGELLAEADERHLLTWPELDHYRPRDALEPGPHRHLGPLHHLDAGEPMRWRDGAAARVFAYLQGAAREYDVALAALNALPADWDVILAAPGGGAARGGRAPAPHVRRVDGAVRLDALLPELDVGVSHGSLGMAAAFLAAGAPQVALPRHAEQLMTARCVGETGCGVGFSGEPTAAQVARAIRKTLERPEYRASARAIAETRRSMDRDAVAGTVAEALLARA